MLESQVELRVNRSQIATDSRYTTEGNFFQFFCPQRENSLQSRNLYLASRFSVGRNVGKILNPAN